MIRKLKIKFVLLAMISLLILLVSIVTGMNIFNYNSVVSDADVTLDLLSGNKGDFPDFDGERPPMLPPFIRIETPYESRYFSVLLDDHGNILQTDTRRVKAVDAETAVIYAQKAFQSGKERAFLEEYRFVRTSEEDVTRIIFLDCGKQLHTYRKFLISSICMSAAGFLCFFGVIIFFSGKILKPVTESYEKQKRFITDAGHEIKTPLAIIKADADVLEMEFGENEWLDGIKDQIQRLSGLTSDLVYLSRMEESDSDIPMIEFPISDVVSETAMSFQALAQTQNKVFLWEIPPMLSYTGNEKAIRQLVNILMDNALKYSPEHGQVSITMRKVNRQLCICVYNTSAQPITSEQLGHLFERFYRADASRSSQNGGYGIGLSVAKAITAAHNGKITANSPDGNSLEVVVQLPVN